MLESTKYKIRKSLLGLLLLLGFILEARVITAQNCAPEVPIFTVDLSGDANGLWTSPFAFREGYCCSATSGCVGFVLTLHPDAEGVIFDVCEGAVSSGAMYYQVDCGPQTEVGNSVCLNGVGPHYITFCKPGNNENKYCITSVSEPEISDNITINDGCSANLMTRGFDPSTIQWNSVYPGITGAYNHFLSCSTCENPTVQSNGSFPPYIDFEVCGYPYGSCDINWACLTVRVYFNGKLAVTTDPVKPMVCNGLASIPVTAVPQGGTAPYTYTWSNGYIGSTPNLAPGVYQVTIDDATDCPPAVYQFEVLYQAQVTEALVVDEMVICEGGDHIDINGQLKGTTSGYWKGHGGSFSNIPSAISNTYFPTAAELAAGSFYITLIPDPVATCPVIKDSVRVSVSNFSSNVYVNTENLSCAGIKDGRIEVFINGGYAPYTFDWGASGLPNSAVQNNLGAGNYQVLVTNALGCDTTLSTSLTVPSALSLSILDKKNVSCNGGKDAMIKVEASGGVSPYSYAWTNVATNLNGNTLNGIKAGNWSLNLTDANGCVYNQVIVVAEPAPLLISPSSDVTICKGESTTIGVSSSGGTGNIRFVWSNGLPDMATHTVSPAMENIYTVHAVDGNNCASSMEEIFVDVSSWEQISWTKSDVRCSGASDGKAEILVTGGDAPFIYNWLNPGLNDTKIQPALPAANYQVNIINAFGCDSTISITIAEPEPLSIDLVKQNNLRCFESKDGALCVEAQGGTLPYNYVWTSASSTINGSDISGLSAGTYDLLLTDSKGCTMQTQYAISQPKEVLVNLSEDVTICPGVSTSLGVTASGGVGSLHFKWSNGAGDVSAQIVSPSKSMVYSVSAEDEKGCVSASDYVYVEVSSMGSIDWSHKDVSCFGRSDGSAEIFVTGGSGPYSYNWLNPNLVDNPVQSALSSGTYLVRIENKDACDTTFSIEIKEPLALGVDLIKKEDLSCYASGDGVLQVAAKGGTIPYAYSWNKDGETYSGASLTGLSAGLWSLSLSDKNGCITNFEQTLYQPNEMLVTSSGNQVICEGQSVIIGVNCSGGTGAYDYNWSQGLSNKSSHSITPLVNTLYTATVTDERGCETETEYINIEVSSLSGVESTVKHVACYGEKNGSVELLVNGGNAPFSYDWTNVNLIDDQPRQSALKAGNYIVDVKDVNGCVRTLSVNVNQPAPLLLNVTEMRQNSCYNSNDALAKISASGGTPTYKYTWDGPLGMATGNQLMSMKPGTWLASVEDANGCLTQKTIEITEPEEIVLTPTNDQEVCPNEEVLVGVNSTGGVGSIKYHWSENLGNSSYHQINPVQSATYTVLLEDENGCFSQPADIYIAVKTLTSDELELRGVTEVCPGESAEITSIFNGQYGPYSFFWEQGFGNSPGTIEVTPKKSGYYSFTVLDICKHVISDSIYVKVFDLPTISLPGNFGAGCEPLDLDFELGFDINPGASIKWNFGDGIFSDKINPTHRYSEAGVFQVSLSMITEDGCFVSSGSAKSVVTVFESPEVEVIASPAVTSLDNPDVEFSADTDGGPLYYEWDLGNGDFAEGETLKYKFSEVGDFSITLTVLNDWGCSAESSASVRITPNYDLVVPNVFTPSDANTSGYFDPKSLSNDIFYPFTENVEKFELRIFNRWGELIFESYEINYGWNGFYKGMLCQQDVYAYSMRVEYIDGKVLTKRGDVTLLR